MNLNHTSQRNRLLPSTVSNLLMVNRCKWTSNSNLECYQVCLQSGRHRALDKATGLTKDIQELKKVCSSLTCCVYLYMFGDIVLHEVMLVVSYKQHFASFLNDDGSDVT